MEISKLSQRNEAEPFLPTFGKHVFEHPLGTPQHWARFHSDGA